VNVTVADISGKFKEHQRIFILNTFVKLGKSTQIEKLYIALIGKWAF